MLHGFLEQQAACQMEEVAEEKCIWRKIGGFSCGHGPTPSRFTSPHKARKSQSDILRCPYVNCL